ncbi:MAG: hypothetical protein M0C28_26570 [Candidatus Moduliflexus flocculans]|nr:hypothetical protein [Candidatus Moduliflexus flocculans]
MQPAPENPDVVLGVDFLASEGYGEVIGGGQRIHDLRPAREAARGARSAAARPTNGTSTCASTAASPTRGFGMGIERMVVLDLRHQAHPRDHPLPPAPLQDLSLTRPTRGAPGGRRAGGTVALISLGCAKNLVDSEVMLGALKAAGYAAHRPGRGGRHRSSSTPAASSDRPARRPRRRLGEVLRPEARGPAEEDRRRRLSRGTGPGPAWSGNSPGSTPGPGSGASTGSPRSSRACASREPGRTFLYSDASPRLVTTPGAWAYVKVSEGCSHRCGFCAIPLDQGPLRLAARGLDRPRGPGARPVSASGRSTSSPTTRPGSAATGDSRTGWPGSSSGSRASTASPGSASSTAIPRRSRTACSRPWPARRSAATSTSPSSMPIPASSRP